MEKVKVGLKAITDAEADSILLYSARDQRWLSKEIMGQERGKTGNML